MDRQRDRRSGRHPALVGRRNRLLRPPRVLRATRAGWCFVAIIFGVGFAALNTGNNLLYLVLALMLAFLVLSGLLSETSLRGIRIERMLPRELFALAQNRIVLRVHNEQRRNSAFAITIEDQFEDDSGRRLAGRCFALRIGAGGCANRSYAFEPERRGDLRFTGLRVSTRFPFGLFVKSRDLELEADALVYPAVRRLSVDRTLACSDRQPDDADGPSNDGDEIAGLRERVPGDSVSRVHWRSSLRAGRLLVGEREGITASEFEVLLRLPPEAADGVVEERVARAASEVVTHLEIGARVGLRSKRMRIPPGTGAAHRSELLTFLARIEPDNVIPDGAAESIARGVSP
jgi:uncharacterized protein (DUF58 family)